MRPLAFLIGALAGAAATPARIRASIPARRRGNSANETLRALVLPPAATPAAAIGNLAIGGLVAGALAVGAAAIGALAIGSLAIRKARLKDVEIDRLTVRHLSIVEDGNGAAEAGAGDENAGPA